MHQRLENHELDDRGVERVVERAPILWIHEAIEYLGLDRLGLARPDLAIHRLIRKGALHPKKICGRLAFDLKELELVAGNGDSNREEDGPGDSLKKP